MSVTLDLRAQVLSPVAWWDFNSPSVSEQVLDNIGQRVATLEGGVAITSGTLGRSGVTGDRALDFAPSLGPDAVARISQVAFLNDAASVDQLTVVAWQRLYDLGTSTLFWGTSPGSPGSQRGINVVAASNGVLYFDHAGCCDSDERLSGFVPGWEPGFDWSDWHHFAFVKSGSEKQIWIDGRLFLAGSTTLALPTDFTELRIGAAGVPGWITHARIDDFAIYDRALTAGQIGALAGGGSPIFAVPELSRTTWSVAVLLAAISSLRWQMTRVRGSSCGSITDDRA